MLYSLVRLLEWKGNIIIPGQIEEEITGGNLSLIFSLIGTPGEPKTDRKILFIEEVGEYYYHLDRMMTSLKLSGKIKNFAALVVGGITEMYETKIPWGKSHEEIISDIIGEYNYPVFFNFPAGHISDNRAFYIGKRANIEVKGKKAILSYL